MERTATITLTESQAMEIMHGLWCVDSELNKPDKENAEMIRLWKRFIRDNFDPEFCKDQ